MLSKSHLKKISSLKNKKFRNQSQLFLIEGSRNCLEAIQSDFIVETLLFNPKNYTPNIGELIDLASNNKVSLIEISDSDVKQLAETVNSQGIFCVVQQKQFSVDSILEKKNGFVVLIDSGQDPGNLGTIIRTCDWFGIDAIFLSKENVELYNSKVIRSTMGSVFHLPVIEDVDFNLLLPRMKQQSYHIFAADVKGKYFYHQQNYEEPVALILGNENRGIEKENLNFVKKTIKIPLFGKAESLNIASAGAVLISHISLKLK